MIAPRLLIGIAALFLATGTAHAINVWSLICPGDVQIDGEVVKDEQWRKTEDAGYSLTISGGIDENGNQRGVHGKKWDRLRLRQKDGETYLNGKRCQPCWYNDCSKDRWKHCKENNPDRECKP
jgi:hypothetical protein